MNKIIEMSNTSISLEPTTLFEGISLLYGSHAFKQFQQSHVLIVGIGGVGSWAAEAIARSGIGHISLMDPDRVALTNRNRQIQALESTMDQFKVDVLAKRLLNINPHCKLTQIIEKLTVDNVSALLEHTHFDYVIDAIDDVFAKVALILYCTQKQIPIVTVGGAGGQMDPTLVSVCDLAKTEQEPLLAKVRKRLRQKHGFPRGTKPFGIDAVYSKEPLKYPDAQTPVLRFGTSVVVTATFGMTAASLVLRNLAQKVNEPPVLSDH